MITTEQLSINEESLTELVKSVEQQHADYLWSTPRYDRYRRNEDLEEWLACLGPDVLLATHSSVTAKLAQTFVEENRKLGMNISKLDELILKIAALDHDWGEIVVEGFGVGDVSYELKTSADGKVEEQVFEKIIAEFPESPEKDFIRQSYYEVAQNKESYLGKMFNAIERVGYLQTALKVYRGYKYKRIENWRGLVGNTFSNQIEKLNEYAREYPYVKQVLIDRRAEINRAFAELATVEIPPLDRNGQSTYSREKLLQQAVMWQTIINSGELE
jgi:hypothetical protein